MEERRSEHEDAPPTLDYRAGSDDRVISKVQFWWGSFVGMSALFVAVFVGVLGSLDFGKPSRGTALFFWTCVIAAVVLINGLAIYFYRGGRWRSLALGLWIGFGVGALIEGACFGILR
jgi:hypothetical protein